MMHIITKHTLRLWTLTWVLGWVSVTSIVAQNSQIKVGPQIQLDDETSLVAHVASDLGQHFFLVQKISRKRNAFSILAIDDENNELWVQDFGPFDRSWRHLDFFLVNDHLVWVSRMRSKKDKEMSLFYQKITFTGESTPATHLYTAKASPRTSKLPQINYVRNAATGLFGAVAIEDADDKKAKLAISTILVDTSFSIHGPHRSVTPLTQKKAEINDVYLGTDGQFNLALLVYNNQKERRYKRYKTEKIADFDFELLRLAGWEKEIERYPVRVDGVVPTHIQITELPNGNIILGGAYQYFAKRPIKGYYHHLFSPQLKDFVHYKEYDFSKPDLDGFGGRNITTGLSGRRGISLSFKPVAGYGDDFGGHYVVWEKQYETSSWDPFTQVTQNLYHADDIIVIHLGGQGDVIKTFLVPKLDASREPFDLGHASGMLGNELVLVYNDNIKNIQEPNRELRFYRSSGQDRHTFPIITTISGAEMQRQVLLEEREKGEYYYPFWSHFDQRSKGYFFTFEMSRSDGRFVRKITAAVSN